MLTKLGFILFFTLLTLLYIESSSGGGKSFIDTLLALFFSLVLGTLISNLLARPSASEGRGERERRAGTRYNNPRHSFARRSPPPPRDHAAGYQPAGAAAEKPADGPRPEAERKQARPAEREGTPPDEYAGMALGTLYRLAAKHYHPDLATDKREQRTRTQVMADLNEAYRRGDRRWIIALLKTLPPDDY